MKGTGLLDTYRRAITLLLPILAAWAAGCGGDGATSTPTAPASPVTAVTTPATPGTAGTATPAPVQVSSTPVPNGYRAVSVLPQANFDRMVALVPIPGDTSHAVVLTQQDGVIYRMSLTDDTETPTVFLNIKDRLIENPGNEEGLLGLAFSPRYESDHRFYVTYSAGNLRRNTVARYTASGNAGDPASGRVLIEVMDPFFNHNGGGIVFGPDGYLYFSIGDGGSAGDPQRNGQNRQAMLGKIHRIDVSGDDYAVPADNPFAGTTDRGEIWAYGLRNPWRFTFDRQTGEIWAGDVGQNAWEEIDRITKGGNYGWSIVEGPDCFREENCDRTGLIAPRTSYRTHEDGTCSVTGGYVYRGNAMPELNGWYIYGDFCSGRVWALDTTNESSEPIILMDSGKSIASFAEDPAGEVYLVTFNNAVYRISRR